MTSRSRWTRIAAAAVALVAVVVAALAVVLLALGRPPGDDWLSWPAAAAATLAALAYGPVRRGVLRGLRVLTGTQRRSPDAVVAGFAERVSRGRAVDDLLLDLAEAMRREFGARRAEVWTADGVRLTRVAAVPDARPASCDIGTSELDALARVGVAGEAWLALWAPSLAAASGPAAGAGVRITPARHGGTVLGVLLVERERDPFSAREDRALGELGRRLGDLLRNRQLDSALRTTLDDLRVANVELRASRARVVAAADAERRRLERDVHDGAQQDLVALAVNIGLARDRVEVDPPGAAALLDRLAADARAAVEHLRELAQGIYPPLLMDAGLDGALRGAARRSPQQVTVDAAVGRLPAALEATVYFCCLEALQNVAKHAPGAAVTITVSVDERHVRFVVADGGPGFDPTRVAAGRGLHNMADRVGAAGGSLALDAAPGAGTTVTGTIPR